jgi:hypothetical protein
LRTRNNPRKLHSMGEILSLPGFRARIQSADHP